VKGFAKPNPSDGRKNIQTRMSNITKKHRNSLLEYQYTSSICCDKIPVSLIGPFTSKLLTIRIKYYITNRPKLNAPNATAESR
jgi:hypothetical protein